MTDGVHPLPRVSAPAGRALASAGITSLDDLAGMAEAEVLALHGIGPAQLGVLRQALAQAHLAFGEPVRRPRATGRNDNKTLAMTEQSPRDWIQSLPTARRVADGLQLLEMFNEATGVPAVMWGASMVGYGHHHYVYDSGREGDTFRVGFSPRASSVSLYGLVGAPGSEGLLDRLGPHTTGVGCLYVSRLARVDHQVLAELITAAWTADAPGSPC